MELYSKHPLARAILAAANEQKLQLQEASRISEPPGQGLRAIVAGREVQITNRENFSSRTTLRHRSFLPWAAD